MPHALDNDVVISKANVTRTQYMHNECAIAYCSKHFGSISGDESRVETFGGNRVFAFISICYFNLIEQNNVS